MKVNYHKTTSRRPWMMREIPEILKRADRAMTLAQITNDLNAISNPSDTSARRWKKADWEYHLGVASYPEVTTVLKRLVAKGLVEKDTNRRKNDPISGRTRYTLANPLIRLAAAFSGPGTSSGPGLLLQAP